MSSRTVTTGVALVGMFVLASPLACAQEATGQGDTVPYMRVKLAHTQEIVEALALADFDGIARNAQKLSLMSLESGWNVLQTPEYHTASKEFRESVQRLTDAAKERNLDGTTLAYFEVTLNCVRCHKYLRQRP